MDIRILNIDSKYNVTPHNRESLLAIAQGIHVWRPDLSVVLVSKELMDHLFPPRENPRLDLKEVKRVLDEREFSSEQFVNRVRFDFLRSMEEATDFWRRIKCTVTSVYMAAYSPDMDELYSSMLNGMAVRMPFADAIGDSTKLENTLDKDSKVTCEDLHMNIYKLPEDPSAKLLRSKTEAILNQHESSLPQQQCILLCMERLVNSAKAIKRTPGFEKADETSIVEVLTAWWVIHLMTTVHLGIDDRRCIDPWQKTIDDGLVTAFALSIFKQRLDANIPILRQYLESLPVEFRTHTFFDRFPYHDLVRILEAWKQDDAETCMMFCPPQELLDELSGGKNAPIYPEFKHCASEFCHPQDSYWAWLGLKLLENLVSGDNSKSEI